MEKSEQIKWRPWTAEAFESARQTARPVFLSISASWCHWCHVMDQDSFDHPEVIRRINRDFIPIRVDSDKRPDINSRYNMGGWPTVAILDADGRVRVGETYLQTGQLLAMLSSIENELPPARLERPGEEVAPARPYVTPSIIDQGLVESVADSMARVFDPEFGGFGGPPKFPQTWALDLSFHLHQRTGDPNWLKRAVLTLDNMRESGLYDRADGGFFRYAIRGDWDSPHFEKLLEVNARMLSLYLKAFSLTDEALYRSTAQGVLDYLLTTLKVVGQPWFHGSQSADEDYYSQSEEDRMEAEPPPLDRTLYVDQNAVTVSALLNVYAILGQSKYLDAATELIDFLWTEGRRPETGMVHCGEGASSLTGYLSDQVHMMTALLDAFEATGEKRYLEQSLSLLMIMNRDLWDGESGGYWDLPADRPREGILNIRIKPFVENAAASMALTRLYHLTGRDDHRNRSEAVLMHLSTVYKPYKHHAAPFALAVEQFLNPPHFTVIVGSTRDARWIELIRAARRIKSPWNVVLPLDAEADKTRLQSLGYPTEGETRAYLCAGTTCHPPVTRPEELDKLILKRTV